MRCNLFNYVPALVWKNKAEHTQEHPFRCWMFTRKWHQGHTSNKSGLNIELELEGYDEYASMVCLYFMCERECVFVSVLSR